VTLAPASTQSHWEMQGFNVQFSTQQLHRKLEHGCLCSWNRLMACTALPARRRAVKGPAMYWPKSRTRMPCSARPLDASCDMCTRAAVSTDQARRAVSRTNSEVGCFNAARELFLCFTKFLSSFTDFLSKVIFEPGTRFPHRTTVY
jgi:hypothetical protein